MEMSDWRVFQLEDCMDAIIDYRGKSPNKTTSGVPLITAKVIKNGRIEQPDEFIAEEDYEAWMSRGLPRAGDVVMTTEAPLGEVAQLDGRKVALAQRIITLRGKQGVLDQDFLKYLLQSQQVQEDHIKAEGSDAVARHYAFLSAPEGEADRHLREAELAEFNIYPIWYAKGQDSWEIEALLHLLADGVVQW